MATINLSLEVDSKGAIKGIKQFTAATEKMGKKGSKSAAKLQKKLRELSVKAGKGFASLIKTTAKWGTVLAGLAGTVIIGKVIKASAKLEAAMLGVRKTTGLSADAIKGLRNEFIEISKSSPVTASELAAIGEVAGQLGIQGKKSILEFTKTISQIAVTTDLTAEEAAVSMAQLKNVLGEPIENVKLLGSVMNELSNTTVATARDITDLSLRMGGAAKTLGLTSSEVMAFAATMRDAGVSVEVGGTAMSQVFTKMLVDTEKFANVAGVSFDEFSTMIKTKPVEAIKLFITQLSKMETFKKAEAIKSLGLEGVRIVGVISKLSDNMAGLNKNLKTADDEFERGTSLQKEFDIFIQGTTSQLTILGNRLSAVAFEIGDTLLPIINDLIKTAGDDLVEVLKGVSKWFTENREEVRRLVSEGYLEFKEITKDLVVVLKALKTPLFATVELFKKLAGLFTDTVDPAKELRKEIKLLEHQISTGTQFKKGFWGLDAVKAAPEDFKRLNRQLEFFKAKLKEVEGGKKTFTVLRGSISKTTKELQDNGNALRDTFVRAFGDLEAGYKGQIKGLKTVSKELKKFHKIKSKLILASLDLEKRSILSILKEEKVGLAKREKLSKKFIQFVKKQEIERRKIITTAAAEQIKGFAKTSAEAIAIKANEVLAIQNLEKRTAIEITQFKKVHLKENVKNSVQANLDILHDFQSTTAQKREALDNLKDKNLNTVESFKVGWQDAMIGPNGFKSSTEKMWDLGSQVFTDLRIAQRALTDTIFEGGNIMKSVWQGVGKTVENLGKQAFANAMDIIIEKTIGSAAAAMGMGAGTAAGWGSAKGGAWGAAAEVAIYLAQAAAAFVAGKAIAKNFAQGGMIDDLGRLGLIGKGTGSRSDDVRVRSFPNANIMASKGEYIVNADATKENLSLLELMNQSKENILGFGGGGFFGSVGGALGDVIGGISKIDPGQSFDERVNFLADILTAGGALSFLHGWLKAGDWIQGIPSGVGTTVAYAVSTLLSAGVAKEANFLFRKDGGEIGCEDCSSWGKENKHFGFGGFFKKAFKGIKGVGKKILKAPTDLMSEVADVLPGGDLVSGVLDNVGDCIDTLADPKKVVNLMIKKFFETTRKPAVPVAKAILTPRSGLNIESDFFSDLIGDALSLDMFKDMLGPCSPEKIMGFAEGGIINEPTLMIGTKSGNVGMMAEDGAEAIVPLGSNIGGGGGGQVVNVFVENLFAKDINQIVDEINEDNSDRNIGDFRLTVEKQDTSNFNLVSR